MKYLSVLNKYFWKYKTRFFAGIIFVTLSNYFNVLSPQVMRFIINYVDNILQVSGTTTSIADDKSYGWLLRWILTYFNSLENTFHVVILSSILLLLLAFIRGIFLFLMRQTLIVMSRYIEFDQKNEIFQKYLSLDTAFLKQHATGDLMNRIAEDVSKVRSYTGPAIMYMINLVTVISLSIFFMWQSSPHLTIYVLVPLPILAVIIYFVNTVIHKKSEQIQASLSDLTSNAQESYSGIRIIKSFVQEKIMYNYFTKNSEKYRKNALALAKVEAIYFPSITLLVGLSILFTIMIGGIYYINHQHGVTLGTIVEFVVYVNMLTFPVSAIGLTASMVQRAAASQKRINEFLDIKPTIKNDKDATPLDSIEKIEFENVNFIYENTGIMALKNFNLTIKKGEKIAITGKTGSGKSTIAQLLLRMYETNSGTIKINEKSIQHYQLNSVRKKISYVPQEIFLFSDTILNNIKLGDNTATLDKVKNAATLAHVHNEIESFEHQYETVVGERGVTLSGGQKQRVSIARALLKDADLLILDDCLSAVDAKVEKEITDGLNSYLKNKTAIIITHRIFSLLNFDKIIVLDEGNIAEMGSHSTLMNIENGLYKQLYQMQQEETDKT